METYTVNVECSNCQRDGQIQVAKGTLVPDVAVCPICECETAKAKCLKPYTQVSWPSIPQRPIDWGNAWGMGMNTPFLHPPSNPTVFNHATGEYQFPIHQGNKQ